MPPIELLSPCVGTAGAGKRSLMPLSVLGEAEYGGGNNSSVVFLCAVPPEAARLVSLVVAWFFFCVNVAS